MKKVAIAVVVIVGVVIAGMLVIVLFTPTPVTWIISPFTSTSGYYPDLSISMRIGGGWGRGYHQWKIDGYGHVSYEGDYSGPWASVNGSAKLTPQQVEELVAAVRRANLWAMEDGNVSMYLCTDCDTVDFSITLNGQSKRVSYFINNCDGSMGRPTLFWPAQGLCDLQNKIEAIDRDRLAIPTATYAPPQTPVLQTATPVPPPTPTIRPPPFMATGDFGILSQEPCAPPCFLGIRPGVTTFEEAALILQNAGAPCVVITRGKSLLCQSGDTSIGLSTTEPCTPDNGGLILAEIGLRPPARITLDEFIARYGPPDLLIAAGGASPAMFSHDDLQALVFLPSQLGPQPPYTFTPDTIISYFAYETVTGYVKCVQMEGNKLQPWRGYGTYTPKMNS